MFIFEKKNKRRREKFFTYVAVNLQGLFARWLLDNKRSFQHFHPRRPPESVGDSDPAQGKKKKKEKCKLTPVYWRFSSLCLPRDALPWLQTLFYILISTVTIGRRGNAYKSDKQGPGCRGTCFWAEKFQKQFFKLRCLSPALVRRDKVLEEHTHGAGVSVCTGHERHLVALTDACRKQRSNCFMVMGHQPSHRPTPARGVAPVWKQRWPCQAAF